MASFSDFIPWFSFLLFAIALIVTALILPPFIARLRRLYANLMSSTKAASKWPAEKLREIREEREQVGTLWFFAEIAHILVLGTIFFAFFTILDYLITSPPNTSIFDLVLGRYLLPTVSGIGVTFMLKSVGLLWNRHIKGAGGPEL